MELVSDLSPLALCTVLRSSFEERGRPIKGFVQCPDPDLPTGSSLDPFNSVVNIITHLDMRKLRVRPTSLLPLGGCRLLRELNLSGSRVDSLGPLGGCTALEHLDLSSVVADDGGISPLSDCTSLRYLLLSRFHEVSDLEPLGSLRLLEYLDLSNTSVIDLSPLRPCTRLVFLCLANLDRDEHGIRDLGPISGTYHVWE
jgi:Leucine-rich repeat (LRR) protein